MNHFLTMQEPDRAELLHLIQTGIAVKNHPERYANACERKGILMLFQKTSTRTSLSFQSGIGQMGGYAVPMDWNASNFSISPIRYEARYASRNCDFIVARLKKHADLQELAAYSSVPVINGCCDRYHPCQALADLMTIYEVSGTFEGVTVTYVGIQNNVANSLIAGCLTLGIRLILVTPIINEASWDGALMDRAFSSGHVTRMESLPDAAAQSDYVYTDTWVDMEHFHHADYEAIKDFRMGTMLPYQLNKGTLNGHTPYIMHDMPIHPGFEIEEELIESASSIIYQQAENRMHAQKALLMHLLQR
ncbi:ornithine carbamoyltransferase [Paenibacillus sacheonensis]|uniref:Ornithine carbamoyltransferase n=1 Tax=Paenibacillus sacheonensis TaxID=742054 RepID=A0A7X4YP81_9BACL|nr:ornithine carbamoyltransferase [Paenibacillus sacheonensis]MBM7565236.1 ornithine carbamoyltransferase [Paenibacillus sacheonensis]NBC69988.1 ornithine carbamoyltransferase [Paenibacillus sacheonensis]